jgi:ABC transporter substrate binding protein (PQQ-dependent alcohol dehydrogenase system)
MALLLSMALTAADPARAQEPIDIPIVYVTKKQQEKIPLSLVEPILEDRGLMGARAAIKDNNTTGTFLKQTYELVEVVVPEDGDLTAALQEQLAAGRRLFVADLHAGQLLALADLPDAADALILNARAMDDRLRNEDCRGNVMHVMPSRAMKADALAQYLHWKRWTEAFVVHGQTEADLLYLEAVRRAAKKFNIEIVEERVFTGDAPSARTDTGHVQIQTQMPVFTQDAEDHDVVWVVDEADIFGEYLPYRTWEPRPVVGTQGLWATAWHRVQEQWGGTQVQRRFEKFSGRDMEERDYTAWAAVRAIGEAVTRAASAEAGTVKDYLYSDDFKLAAFKGEALTFRKWNGQLRQPIILVQPRALITVSPQQGFLHQVTPLDTMGYDEPESACHLDN